MLERERARDLAGGPIAEEEEEVVEVEVDARTLELDCDGRDDSVCCWVLVSASGG